MAITIHPIRKTSSGYEIQLVGGRGSSSYWTAIDPGRNAYNWTTDTSINSGKQYWTTPIWYPEQSERPLPGYLYGKDLDSTSGTIGKFYIRKPDSKSPFEQFLTVAAPIINKVAHIAISIINPAAGAILTAEETAANLGNKLGEGGKITAGDVVKTVKSISKAAAGINTMGEDFGYGDFGSIFNNDNSVANSTPSLVSYDGGDSLGGVTSIFSGVLGPLAGKALQYGTQELISSAFPSGKSANISSIQNSPLTQSAFSADYTSGSGTAQPTNQVSWWTNATEFVKTNPLLAVAVIFLPLGIVIYGLYRLFFKRKR